MSESQKLRLLRLMDHLDPERLDGMRLNTRERAELRSRVQAFAEAVDRADGAGRVVVETMRELREAIDDLWGCIGTDEVASLQPETILVAQENHELLCHAGASS